MSLLFERNKRSRCLITLFAILPADQQKSEDTLKTFNDLSRGNTDSIHFQKDVYLPDHPKDNLFGTMTAVCDLKQKNKKKKNQNVKEDGHEEDDYWYLELSGKEIVFHKHECLIRNVDYIPISSNFESLLLFLGHKHSFSYIQQGIMHYVPHFGVTVHIYTLQQIFDKTTKVPLEKDKKIIEMFIEVKATNDNAQTLEKTEQKLLEFSQIFEHLHWFKIQPSSCKTFS